LAGRERKLGERKLGERTLRERKLGERRPRRRGWIVASADAHLEDVGEDDVAKCVEFVHEGSVKEQVRDSNDHVNAQGNGNCHRRESGGGGG
jgi:hypothetical protein